VKEHAKNDAISDWSCLRFLDVTLLMLK